jgi:hypothetical protein
MALAKTLNSGPPLNQRGQGAVEAILALPVFLVFVCLIFQLFFLGMAQIQLQYAAFYAARVGAVHGADQNEMKRTVTKILGQSQELLSLPRDHIEIEIMDFQEKRGEGTGGSKPPATAPLKVRVHWHYPLFIPLADTFLNKNILLPDSGRPSLHLQASWTMTMFGSILGIENNAKSPQP